MAEIIFKNPIEKTLKVAEGMSILEAAVQNAVPLEHDCGGNCACTTCWVFVDAGGENLSAMSEDERALLESQEKLIPNARLGCQSRVLKSDSKVVVRIPEN